MQSKILSEIPLSEAGYEILENFNRAHWKHLKPPLEIMGTTTEAS